MSTQTHWLIKDAKMLPLGNIFEPLSTSIDEKFIEALRHLAASETTTVKDYRRLIEVHEQARTIIVARVANTVLEDTTE